jgi:hypothetical protein
MAQKFVEEFDWPIPTYVDNYENDFDNEYGAWPDRIFVFDFVNSVKTLVFKAELELGGIRYDSFTSQLE